MSPWLRAQGVRGMAILALCAAATVGCTTASQTDEARDSASPVAATSAKDPEINAMLPAAIKSAGVIRVATDATYPPMEFFGPDNKTLQGLDIDLGAALGAVMGVKFAFDNVAFDTILPSLGVRYDIGMSSLNDTKLRQEVVDMVDYYTAGATFMVRKGQNQDLGSLTALCGKHVAVGKGSIQFDDVVKQSDTCRSEGKPQIDVQAYPDQTGANLAVVSGRADVVLADRPTVAFAVSQSNGTLEEVGQPYNSALASIAVPKGAEYQGLAEGLQAGLRKLADDGTYQEILSKWNLQAGAITDFTINGAQS